ncbi:hypothetical protein mru_1292 [Methanobrevibacter ruminantium M1]|uniref:Uncharacterized protein n=1 Tax=Methanobrevibacter ruminantium (strain ATCC 35063 / DSM 1093 / JCM 13430 / OCM 146 / M1) TaxID=634498 RepID=D3E3N1_METRM|nr:hypothetical protein [Methanobrevibacter ruminantium]ADC47142.1 hypothetical protein mru_1292 [Methanobrevibacter ruminantium M1]
MGFKEDNKDKYLDPFKRVTVDVGSSFNRINVSADVIGNRIRITVPKDKSGNLTGTIVENIALENSTWIFEPVADEIMEDRIDRKLSPRKYMDLSKFDFERGFLPKEILDDLVYPINYRKDYSPFAKKVLEHPNDEIRKIALGYIDDEDVLASIILFSKDKDLSLFVLEHIKDKSILLDIVRNDFNYYYFTGAVDIFYDMDKLPLKLFDLDIRKAALERIDDKELLFDLAFDCEEWFKPIDMIKDNNLLSKKELDSLNLYAQNREIREIIKSRLKNEL